ncbi:helix-turn-helix domain-containing protein [Zhongshania aquimaris]|uniref:DUF4115 domain-containing protein n=1 Tax=Zhongshania aquimaris TaxID=2857107 RepID=A0ABS6VW69_9GAMM|nr:RodZ domain-containing protein [Zhongshania aquimaris]MBW2942591.1 DUF4115 domain-containing protein [Zhongshania aquimaris]
MPGPKNSYPGPPGSVLHDARISAGKSVLETAEALNLLNSYVEAIEENDYSRFNSPLFARGYIKSYARYMGLDEAPLLSDCDRICRREEQSNQRSHVQVPGKVQAPGHAGFILALIVALLIWSLSYWIFSGPEKKALSVVVLEQQLPVLPVLRKSPSLGESLLGGEPVKPEEVDVPVVVGEIAELSFKLTEDVWLELRDAHNSVVVSGVQKKGEVLLFKLRAPVTFSTAYWPAVSMYYNERLVELKELAKSNVVRVQVGEL